MTKLDSLKRHSIDELKVLQQQWSNREEAEEDPDFRQEWIEEGIDIYKELIKRSRWDAEKADYYQILADLYLEYGRSEKMINGNDRTAFRHLQQAARLAPEKGDAFYHLAFLAEKMTLGSEKWESAAFYAKEALERGVEEEKEIKIWCLLAKAYNQLGFKQDAAECFKESKKLDREDDYAYFRSKYSKETDEKRTFSRLNGTGGRVDRRAAEADWMERSKTGKCFILKISRHGSTLYGNNASMALTIRQSELLKLLLEAEQPLSSQDIIHSTTGVGGSEERKATSIKTDVSRLRKKIGQELDVEGHHLLETIYDHQWKESRYRWNPKIEKYIIDRI